MTRLHATLLVELVFIKEVGEWMASAPWLETVVLGPTWEEVLRIAVDARPKPESP